MPQQFDPNQILANPLFNIGVGLMSPQPLGTGIGQTIQQGLQQSAQAQAALSAQAAAQQEAKKAAMRDAFSKQAAEALGIDESLVKYFPDLAKEAVKAKNAKTSLKAVYDPASGKNVYVSSDKAEGMEASRPQLGISNVIAPILAKKAAGGKLTSSQEKVLEDYQKINAMDALMRDLIGGAGTGGGSETGASTADPLGLL